MAKAVNRLRALTLALAVCLSILPPAAAETAYLDTTVEYYSNVTSAYTETPCRYTDEWFSADASQRNDSLALASAQMAFSAADGEHAAAFMEALGFENTAPRRYGSPDMGDCAYVMGTKTIQVNGAPATLAAVVFQGARYGTKGWVQNVTVNAGETASGDHVTYASAARTFLSDYDAMGLTGPVVFWLTGFSRAGGIANVASAYLLDRGENVFCCTIEAPATTSVEAAHDEKYSGIHNYICTDDPVVMVPIWGMGRYGQDVVFNTSSLDDVLEETARGNPAVKPFVEQYDRAAFEEGMEEVLRELVDGLSGLVPTRAEFTEVQTLHVETEEPIQYTWQEAFQVLCSIVFRDESGPARGTGLGTLLNESIPYLLYASYKETYALTHDVENREALLAESEYMLYGVAVQFRQALSPDGQIPLSDCCAILKLLSAVLIDTSPAAEPDWLLPAFPSFNYIYYVSNYLHSDVLSHVNELTFAHQPDVILARLRLLNAAPVIEEVDFTIREPALGDSLNAAPEEVLRQAEGMEGLRVRSAWWTPEDGVLQPGKNYYFYITFEVDIASLSDGLQITLNECSANQIFMEREGSVMVVTGEWNYEFASPTPPDGGSGGSGGSGRSSGSGKSVPAVNRNPDTASQSPSQTPGQSPEQSPVSGNPGGGTDPASGVQEPEPPSISGGTAFADVPADAYYAEAVNWAVQMGITTGRDAAHFAPHASCTRGQMVTFLWRAAGKPSPVSRENPFVDVTGNEYYGDAVLWAYETGITKGTDAARFSPGATVSRGQSAAFLYRMAGGQAEGSSPFRDVAEGSYCYDAVRWAAAQGVTQGKTADSFAPNEFCTRAQIVTFLYRLLGQA